MPWWRIRKRKGHEKDKLFEETGEVSKRVKNKGKEKEKKKKKDHEEHRRLIQRG